MSDPTFTPFYSPTAALDHYHTGDAAQYPHDNLDYHKQSFDFYNTQAATDVLAPHPDQFESELDSLTAFDTFDAEFALLPPENAEIFSFLRSDTPTCGPPSTFTVSSESVSGYDSGYGDAHSSRSESYYNFNGRSPTSTNYPASTYSFTSELDMDFKRMGIPTNEDAASVHNSPGSVPNIAHYSPQTSYSSPRGSFSDYEPAQSHQVRISSAASDYYPQVQVGKHHYNSPAGVATSTVSPNNLSSQLPDLPSIPIHGQHKKADIMPEDPKRKYQCPSCPRAFARAYNLKTHIQTHDPNRSKPYACHHKSCGRSFSRKHDLTRHMVSIHRVESVESDPSATVRSIGVEKGPRGWCDNCGKSWVGKGKEKGCDCDDAE